MKRLSIALSILLLGAPSSGCSLFQEVGPSVVTVDFLKRMGLEVNALGPQVVLGDPSRSRVFGACANSSAVAVIEGAKKEVFNIPVGSRMPRRLREQGMKISRRTGKLFLLGAERLIIVDPVQRSAAVVPLPGDFEALDLDEAKGRTYLAGRTRGDLAVVEEGTREVRLIPFGEAGAPLPFMAASAPPPIRIPFVDAKTGRVYVVDGTSSTLVTIDLEKESVLASRKLPVGSFPRWHTAGFDPDKGRIFAALENEGREAKHALAIDARGDDDVVLDLPEGHREPAGVTCDPARGELYIPYDNMKVIHVAAFDGEPAVHAVPLPAAGVDAAVYDDEARTLYAAGWNQAALYIVDMKERNVRFTVPFIPVYPHMNSITLNRAEGQLFIPSGSTAVNGTFGTGLFVFDTRTFAGSTVCTGWAPISLARKPGSEAHFVFGTDREFAKVEPDGTFRMHALPHPYLHQALLTPDESGVFVAYGPHSSWLPRYYIEGARNGIFLLGREGRLIEDRMTPRLVQGMIFDKEGRLWAMQNTWGREEPFLILYPGSGEDRFKLGLPPKVDNECVLRLLALDEDTGRIYVGRTGNLNTEKGLVHEIDPRSRTLLNTWEVGRTPTDIAVLTGKARVYVANFDDDTVSIVHRNDGRTETMPVGDGPFALAAHDPFGAIYVLNHLEASLTILGREKKTLPLPPGALPNNLIVESSRGRVFITAHGESEARVYMYSPREGSMDVILREEHPYGEVTFDGTNAAFQLRGQWSDALFRITRMRFDEAGRLWVTDFLGGKVWILKI